MNTPHNSVNNEPPFGLQRPDWRRRLASIGLIALGLLVLAVSATFLLGGPWDQAALPAARGAEPTTDAHAHPSPGIGEALAKVDETKLAAGLYALALASNPTATPVPAATPVPESEAPASYPAAAPELPAGNGTDVPSAPPAADPPAAEPGGCSGSMGGYALDLFNAINSQRAQIGLPALAADPCLIFVAQLRSDDMATNNYFSHTSPSGDTAFSLMDAYGIPYGWAGENLARNNYPVDQTVSIAITDLMASQGHRDNILSGHYTVLGVAVADDGNGMRYYTMVFVGPA